VQPQDPAPEYFCESKDATSEALTLPSDPALCALEPFMSEFRSKLSTRPAWMLKARGGVGSATPATSWIPVIGYTRVSTEDQRDGFGLKEQKAAIQDYIARDPTAADGAHRVLIMVGAEVASGGDSQREVYRFFVSVARKLARCELVFARTDRANRDVKAAAELREEPFTVQFLDMQGTDMQSAQGKFTWAVKSVFDEYYRLQLAHTIKRSMVQLKLRGVTKGGLPLRVGMTKAAYEEHQRTHGGEAPSRKGQLGGYLPQSVIAMRQGNNRRHESNGEAIRGDIHLMVQAGYGVQKIWQTLRDKWQKGQLPGYKHRRYKRSTVFMSSAVMGKYMHRWGFLTKHQEAHRGLPPAEYRKRHRLP